MIKLADRVTIRSVDGEAVKRYGITGLVLMENAGRGVAESVKGELLRRGRDVLGSRVVIVCGSGNNGGDGFVAARHLANAGARVEVFLLARAADLGGDAAANAAVWRKMNGVVRAVRSMRAIGRHESSFAHASVIVDCLFGTGLARPVRGFFREVIEYVNGLARPVVAVDVPSGIDATTGAVLGAAVRASVTCTMAMAKTGLYQYPGREHAGRIEVVDIGAPSELTDNEKIRWSLMTGPDVAFALPPRKGDSHKGTYGHVVVAGGSPGRSGAPVMAATGAMRAGAGLATIAHPVVLADALEAKTTEVMTCALSESDHGTLCADAFDELRSFLKDKTVLVVGPGLGSDDSTGEFMALVLRRAGIPLVIDADGLNSIPDPGLIKRARGPVVLTPHPGEMARLLDVSTADVQADRMGAASELAARTRATVVLKGAATVTASARGEVRINPTGNPSLASAGTGDVLAGVIGALLAQGLDPMDAASVGAFVHGRAAEEVSSANGGEAGLLATDLLPVIPRVIGGYGGGQGPNGRFPRW